MMESNLFESYSRVTRMSRIMWMWDSTILLIIVVGYPLSDIEVAQPKLEYGIFWYCTVLVLMYCTVLVSIDPRLIIV
jgi:hypothetical protein